MLVVGAAHAGADAVDQACRLLDSQLAPDDDSSQSPASQSEIPLSQADFTRLLAASQ